MRVWLNFQAANCYEERVAVQLLVVAPDFTDPWIVFPVTLPVYCAPPAVNEISFPSIFPFLTVALPSVPEISWKVCVNFKSPCESRQVPATLAGTIQSRAVHQD